MDNGDTLTLADRIQHHFTTGISTIEVASKNASRLLSEFEKYYQSANNGVGDYKAFVVKSSKNDAEKLTSLVELLNKNNIHYYAGRATSVHGLNYDTNKD